MWPDASESENAPVRRVLGWEIYSDSCETYAIRGRWRLIWFNPRYRENWRIEGIVNEGVFQIVLGPLGLVYVRSDDY